MGNQAAEEEVASYKILSFRSMAPEQYSGFVYSSWLNSLRTHNDMFRLTDSAAYYAAYSRYITEVLKRPNSRLRIAVLTEDEDVALGWCVDEKETLHYVFVKDMREFVNGKLVGESLRKHGMATALVPKGIKTFSHITRIGLSIWQTKYPSLVFNPFV